METKKQMFIFERYYGYDLHISLLSKLKNESIELSSINVISDYR
jgi:hypothetical protein